MLEAEFSKVHFEQIALHICNSNPSDSKRFVSNICSFFYLKCREAYSFSPGLGTPWAKNLANLSYKLGFYYILVIDILGC